MTTVSVVVVAYDSGPALVRCLRSLDAEDAEVVVVNNGARGPEIAEAEGMEHVTVVEAGGNVGFAAGCNLGARTANADVLLFLNPDTVVEPGAVAALAQVLEDPEIGVAMARLRLVDRPELLNSGGNILHLSGLAWAGGYGDPVETVSELRDVPYPSGAAMAIRAELFRELGGFTEELFMYHEDLELGWRARMRGLRIVVVPAADVYHDYDFERHRTKRYLIERNRLVFVLVAYSLRLLILLGPVLFVTELGMVVLAAKERWLRDKLRGWLWCLRNARWLAGHRREVQRLRRVRDRELAPFLTAVVDPSMMAAPRGMGAANSLLRVYWAAARRAL